MNKRVGSSSKEDEKLNKRIKLNQTSNKDSYETKKCGGDEAE